MRRQLFVEITRRFLLASLSLLLLFSVFPRLSAVSAAAPKERLLSMGEAYDAALRANADYRKAKEDITVKEYELNQAYAAVNAARIKDMIILIAKPRNLGQDIDLNTKVAEAETKLETARKALENKVKSLRFDVEKLYIGALQAMLGEQVAQKKRNEAEKKASDTKKMAAYSLATKEDVEETAAALEGAESAWKLAQLTYKASRLQLSELTGIDLEAGYTFEYAPDYALISQDRIWELIDYAEQNDYGLYQAVSNRRLAEERVNVTRSLYVAKFGAGDTRVIESMYNGKPMDYDLFMANYDMMLELIKQKWEGFYYIPIPIPKSMLQGEYDGLRYFDDKKYALPVFMKELDNARLQENEARKALIAKVKQSYMDMKQSEETYKQALIAEEKAQKAYDQAQLKYKSGFIKKDELDGVQEQLDKAGQNVVTMQLAYKIAVSKLNFDTSGAVVPYLKPGILPYKLIDDGLAPMNEAPAKKPAAGGTWTIEPDVAGVSKQFALKVDAELDATGYQLLTAKGNKPIGAVVPLKEKTKHLNVIFNAISDITVRLYKDEAPIGDAALVGSGSAGSLRVSAPAKSTEGKAAAANPDIAGNGGEGGKVGIQEVKATPEGLSSGTLIIGTFAIDRSALTADNYNAAKATMEASGQGMYYKSEFADGAWFNLDKAYYISEISKADSKAGVNNALIGKLKLSVLIDSAGKLHNLLTGAELDNQIAQLEKDKAKLIEQHDVALENNKMKEAAQLAIETKDIDNETAFLEALKNGDMNAAGTQLGKLNNPGAIVSDLQAEAAAAMADQLQQSQKELEQAVTDGDEAKAAELKKKLEELAASLADMPAADESGPGAAELAANAEAAKKQFEAVAASLAVGGTGGAGDSGSTSGTGGAGGDSGSEGGVASPEQKLKEALDSWLAAQSAASEDKQQLAEDIKAMEAARAILEQNKQAALEDGNTGKSSELDGTLAALAAGLLQLRQQDVLLSQQLVEATIAGLAGPAQAAANMLTDRKAELIAQLQQLETEKYSEPELIALAAIGKQIEKQAGGLITALPAANVIAPGVSMKLEVPPLMIGGSAYIHIRPLTESFGAMVVWNEVEQSVTVSKEGVVLMAKVGSKTAYINGAPIELTVAPRLILGRTFVPLRFVIEALGLNVSWDDKSKTIEIIGTP